MNPRTMNVYLAPVHGLFRQLADAGAIAKDPFEISIAGQPLPVVAGFDLLALLAMLANMEETTLLQIFGDEDVALALLEQVRWVDGICCPRCDQALEPTVIDGNNPRQRCPACGAEFTAVAGTMLEDSALPLPHWFRLIHDHFLASQPASDSELAEAIGVDASSLPSLCSRVQSAMEHEGIPAGDALKAALAGKDRELVNHQFARNVIHYAELVACRDSLLRAKAEGADVADLPPGMSLDEALARLQQQIAEEDQWVWYLENGYILGKPADETTSTAQSEECEEKSACTDEAESKAAGAEDADH